MLDETKNIKDSTSTSNIALKDSSLSVYSSLSYKKTNKLISALYMVTDIMEKDEPLRNKLRTLGADIISDTYVLTTPNKLKVRPINTATRDSVELKISEILSFLEISSSINLISEMNYNILKKEFIELARSIRDYIQKSSGHQPATLSEFFLEESKGHSIIESFHKGHPLDNKGHALARIGVQKGSTLLNALSKVGMSDRSHLFKSKISFDSLKNERRDEIISIIKNNSSSFEGLTITDIKSKAKGLIASCGEKTLQRGLISMVKDNILYKTGSKRWSRYGLAKVA